MNFFGRDLQGPQKLLVIFVAIFLASAGLCGIQLAILNQSPTGSYGGNAVGVLLPLGLIELAAMAVSLVGIVVVLILMAVGSLTRQEPSNTPFQLTERPEPLRRNDPNPDVPGHENPNRDPDKDQ